MSELALKLIKEAKEQRLTRLDLGNCGLTELPDELFELVWLEELILSSEWQVYDFKTKYWKRALSINEDISNNISVLSDDFYKLTNLKILIIRGGRTTKWDLNDIKPLSTLYNLEQLYICHTNVYDITPLANLFNLQQLFLYDTYIENISSLKNLKSLKILEVYDTKITKIDELRELFNLKLLYIHNTQVSDISPLKTIIKKNIPVRWARLGNGIMLENCPVSNPPRHIIEQGNEAILRYWQELENKETVTNNQTKLIFVGNSRAGKTSLWQFLKDKIYNDQADSTHGIKTEIWDTETLGTEDNQNLSAHIWDFGGQEYYHATHRLFLADNAVYVLVWEHDSNKQGTRLEQFKLDDDLNGEIEEVELEHFPASYWLENIQYFAGKHCPVLIVQNKVDEEAQKANYTEGGKNLPNCFHLSVKNAFEFQEGNQDFEESNMDFQKFKLRLLKELRKNATAFKLVKYYAQVREALETKAKDTEYIAVSELKDIALQFDEAPDLENLLAYLKSFTNTVLYFPQNDVLKDRLYLNPTHISRDIYKILNKQVRENNGKFDVTHIKTRLNLTDDQEAERFVALMREFDLIFEKSRTIKGTVKRQFITPQYLPKKEDLPEELYDLVNTLTFEIGFYIQFKSFVPRSLMLRFIASNGEFSNQEAYWRNGIIYKSPTTQSMIKVEYDHEALTFTICVQDKAKQTIDMQNIVEQFVKLENSDDNIKISNDGKTYVELRTIRKLQHEKSRGDIYENGELIPLSKFDWLTQKIKTEENMTLEQLKEKAHDLIGKAKTEEAINTIALWAHENDLAQTKTEITLLKNAWTKLQREQRLGKMSFSESSIGESKINDSVLDLLKNMEMDTDDEFEFNEVETPQTFNELDPNGIIVKFLEYLMSNSKEEGTTHEFSRKTGVHLIKVNNLVKFIARKGYITILTTLPKQCIVVKANYGVESLLRTINQSQIQIGNFPTGVSDKLKILMLTANPANTAKLNLDKEHSQIAIKFQNQQEQFNLILRRAVSASEFKEFTETENPAILHFSGHGEGGKGGGIYVQNEDKNEESLIPTTGLDILFEYFKYRNLALDAVILNACYSEEQAQVIAKHVTYVVGTTVEIGDDFAIAFSTGFYFILGQPNFSFDKIELAFISGRADAATKGALKSHFVLYKNGEKLAI